MPIKIEIDLSTYVLSMFNFTQSTGNDGCQTDVT